MTAAKLERLAVWGALLGLVALCWWYLVGMAYDMSDIRGVMMMGPWSARDWLMMFIMWGIMMVGMMVPTAIRAILIFQRVGEKAARQGKPATSTLWFAAGYAMVWVGFGCLATVLQWALDQASMLSPMMAANSWQLGSSLLFLAGVWQLTPWKETCLEHCQSPAIYISRHFRAGPLGAVRIGLLHGAYCLGCCWALMILLFLAGVMNLVWIGLITLFVIAEKLFPPAMRVRRLSGWLMIAAGIGLSAMPST